MRKSVIFLLVFLLSYLGLVIYANRALYFSRFDEEYWKDKYEHSQWKLPLSIRTIGDDGLYLYEGYRLVKGGDPTLLNAEVPPLGKYAIGLSVLLFGNGHIFGLIATISLLLGTFYLARFLFKQTLPALIVTTLLATDPLITNQYPITMMDSFQAALLITWLLLLLRNRPLLSGIALGLFSSVKIALLSPLLALVSVLFLKKKLTFFLGALVSYLTPYAYYFSQGHSFIDWLKVQKWMISFYLHSNLTPTWGSALTTLLVGKYQNIFSRMWETAPEWSPTWGFLLLSACIAALRFRKNKTQWNTVFVLSGITLLVLSIVPFWTRYLVVILPLLYISGFVLFQKKVWVSAVMLIINIASSLRILFPSPQATVNQVIYNLEHGFFLDLYEDTTTSYKQTINREAFNRFGLQTLSDGEIEFINIEQLTPVNGRHSPQIITMTFTYFTQRLGSFTEHLAIPFVLYENRWRIAWDWSKLVPGLSQTSHLATTVAPARRGSIIGSDKKPLAKDADGVMVWITPGYIDKSREEQLLAHLESTFDHRLPKVALHQRIVGNSIPDLAIPIGVVSALRPEIAILRTFSGVSFTDAYARVTYPNAIVSIGQLENSLYAECCSFLYATTNYDGESGVEKEKNDLLKGINGGTLTLIDQQGKIIRTFLTISKRDGNHVEP